VVGWFRSAAKHHTAASLLLPSPMAQVRKLIDWDKGGLISEEKSKKRKTKQAMQRLLPNISPPAGWYPARLWARRLYSQRPLPLVFMAEYDVIWNEIAFWSAEVSCPSCVPFQLLVHPQPTRWQGSTTGKAFMMCKHCSAIAKNPGVLSVLFRSQIQTIAPYRLLWRKLTPS